MVENDTSSVDYQLSTSTGPFGIPFYFIENAHIVAELYTQNGDEFNKTTLTIDVDYYLNGAGDKDGGQLTLLAAHSGATLLIYRDPDATQLTSYLATGKFPATSHERALDKLTMLIQKFGWWWDSLALKKPNIFANYYDAMNNRIRNLRDPALAQDAATKIYVDSSDSDLQQQITSNFNRSLRVPDSYISQLPTADERAWKGLGFDGAGQPKLQDPAGTGLWGYVPAIGSFEKGSLLTQRFEVLLWESTDEYWRWDGALPKIVLPGSTPDTAGGRGKGKWIDVTDATLRANLGSSEGAKLVYLGEASVALLMQRSIFQYMSATDIEAITSSLGTIVNVDYALQRAIDEGVTTIYYPPCIGVYEHSDSVTLPSGFNMRGHSRRPYTISSDASFNNCGTVIRLKPGASGIFVLSGRHTFTDIVFDGVDKSVGMMNAASQVSGCRFERCGSYRWSRGFGRSSGYVATLYARGCNASGNINGLYNLIDSSVMDSVVNTSESHGVNFQTGANNNSLVRCRVEWNYGYGLFANGATGNIFTGEMIDRNGLAGVCCLASGNWLISAAIVRRSGRLATPGNADNCHFRIEGSGSSIIVDGIRTAAGADDDGGGTITPEYGIITTGSSSNLSVTVGNSLMTGYTIAATNQIVTPANRNYRNNNGLNDTVTNGISQHANGRSSIGADPGSISLAAGGNATYTHSQSALTTFSDPVGGVLDIVARNTTLTTAEYFRANVKISRVGSGAAVVSLTPITTWNTSNWGLSGSSPTGVSVSASISSDGGTLTISLQSIDSSARIVRSKFKDL